MKMKLPKALLMAVLCSPVAITCAYADSTAKILRPVEIIQADTTTENSGTIYADDSIKEKLQTATTDKYQAVAKDGDATLIIKDAGNIDMNAAFVVREGTTILEGNTTTITNISNGYPVLSVAGLNAKLVLDGAKFTTHAKPFGNVAASNGSIHVGGRDGDGTLELKNKAVLEVDHNIFAGGQSRSKEYNNNNFNTFQHNCGSYADKTGQELYRDSQTSENKAGETIYHNFTHEAHWQNPGESFDRRQSTGTIKVEGGSKLLVGQSQSYCNVDIYLTGKGTELSDGHKGVSGRDDWGSNLGDAVYGGTTALVENGAKWIFRNDMNVSTYGGTDDSGFNGDTKITIGKGGTLESLRNTYFGERAYGAKSEMVIENGGHAHITDAIAGFSGEGLANYRSSRTDDIATLTVKKGGKYTGASLELSYASTMTNEGTIQLKDETKVLENYFANTTEEVAAQLTISGGQLINSGLIEGGIFMTEGVFTMLDGAVAAGLTATAGTINLSGDVTFTGAFTLGSGVAPLSVDGDTTPITLVIKQGANISAADFEILDNVSITVLLDEAAAESDVLFTLGYNESDDLTAFDGLDVQLVDADGNATGEVISFGANGNVATTIIPEPTTATLSLLALMGLAARRRRK